MSTGLVFILLFLAIEAVFWEIYRLYVKFGFLKKIFHDVFGWHIPDNSSAHFDGCNTHARCRFCHQKIMQDSQGNWF